MSVGHTYMRTNDFPPPQVPEIPPDFDYCEGTKPGALPVPPIPDGIPKADVHSIQSPGPVSPSLRQPSNQNLENVESKTGSGTSESGGTENGGDSDGEEEEEEEEEEEGKEEEEEGGEVECGDHLDELEDEEFLAYAEMYGEDDE